MPNITYILPDGSRQIVELPRDHSIMEGAIRNGLPGILGECGGSASCATCHIYIEAGPTEALPPCQSIEDDMLDYTAAERLPSSRLACQIKASDAMDGLVIRIADRM